uniref:Tripartite motif containing 42 n=1 Tax=Nothoprocta perdicaria TaxID=30464 RepID=A0A8C7EG05_NOTPE
MAQNERPCFTWPCCSDCCYVTCNSRSNRCCLCWRFVFTNERNCSCFPCPYAEDKACQCCHCSCAEHANCWCCCCTCANNPDCKCICCGGENSACQYYESRCCRSSVPKPHPQPSRSLGPSGLFHKKDNPKCHAFRDQLACPLCKRLFLQPFMLPCNHCICERCITKRKNKAEVTENFFIIICPVCNKAHCLPYASKIQLRKNYLRAKLAKKYMRRHGFLRWRFDRSERPIYCEACREKKRKATKKCRTCGINYCNECLHIYHIETGAQDHIFTKAYQEEHEEWRCILHCSSNLSEYCLDDHELICEFCKNSLHNDHDTIPLTVACSKEAASLFDAIAKFKKVRHGVDNDLMEVLLLKNNFKAYKDTKRKEIRNGFLKLRMVLHEQEKEMMELLENIELKKQKDILEYINYTSSQLSYMDGLIQYSKEALKEESQVIFLQSAHCLVKEIEDIIASIFQPSPRLREDPLKKLQLDFDELLMNLRGLFPSRSRIKQSDSKAEKYPYPCNSDIMVPRHIPSTHEFTQASYRSPSLNSLLDLGAVTRETLGRPSSTPPHYPKPRNEMCAYWDAAYETPKKERKYQNVSFPNTEVSENESVMAPGLVVIYQTVVYPRSAKIYWTCPTEAVDFFEVEFYEVVATSPDNTIQTQLAGQLSNIKQQNLEIQHLDPNTEYMFKVRAVNISGPGEWSDVCKIITPEEQGKVEGRWGIRRNFQDALHT